MNAVIQESLEVATPGNANAREPRVHGAMIPDDPASSTYFDVVVGHVLAREGHRLTVRGATLIRQDGSVSSRRDVWVTVGATTNVTSEDDLMGELDTGAIRVGQRIIVFGDACNGAHGVEIDAIEGHVRIGLSNPPGPVAENLSKVGKESGGAVSGSVAAEVPESAMGMMTPFGHARDYFGGTTDGSHLRATLGVSMMEIFSHGRRRHRPCVGRARPR